MSVVAAIGSVSLGIVVGWLVRFFIRRFKEFGPKTLGSVISILVGGAVVKFLSADPTVLWFYPIGLLAGFIIYTALGLWAVKLVSKGKKSTAAQKKLLELLEGITLFRHRP